MEKSNRLAVMEARWEDSGNYGVRPLFEMISGLTHGNPHDVRYDMFSDSSSFETTVAAIYRTKRYDSVYIASHGENKGLDLPGLTTRTIVEVMARVNSKGRIKGLYFSAFLFGRGQNASQLLADISGTNLSWVAGYRKSVDWLDSVATDILFWNGFIYSGASGSLTKAKHGLAHVRKHMPKVEESLGFAVFQKAPDGKSAVPF